jgi:hypothetical protein
LPAAPGNAWPAGKWGDGIAPGWPGTAPGTAWPGLFAGDPGGLPPIIVAFFATEAGNGGAIVGAPAAVALSGADDTTCPLGLLTVTAFVVLLTITVL